MTTIFLAITISSIISTFITLSKGSLFNENVKGICNIIHYIILITLIVLSAINYGGINIIYIILLDIIVAQISAFIIIKFLYKGRL